MNTFAVIERITSFTGTAVNFYSVRLNGSQHSEFEDFVLRNQTNGKVENELKEIYYWLNEISKKGAEERHFRNERLAVALPPNQPRLFNRKVHLRLYAFRISKNLVFLFNGGIKTNGIHKAEHCPIVSVYFFAAQSFAKALKIKISNDPTFLQFDKTDITPSPTHLIL